MKTIYHGWIYIQKSEGFTDHFTCTYVEDGDYKTYDAGYGATGAQKAVDFFEVDSGRGLGPIKLLATPLGLRVYTQEEEVGDVVMLDLHDLSEEAQQHLKQVGAVEKTSLDYLEQFVEAMGQLTAHWTDELDRGYPTQWPDFAEMYAWACGWLGTQRTKP